MTHCPFIPKSFSSHFKQLELSDITYLTWRENYVSKKDRDGFDKFWIEISAASRNLWRCMIWGTVGLFVLPFCGESSVFLLDIRSNESDDFFF